MMLQINNTDQIYTPRNTGCTSIMGGSLSLAVNDSTSLRHGSGLRHPLVRLERAMIRRPFSWRKRFRFVHPLRSTMLPFLVPVIYDLVDDLIADG